VIRGKLGRGFRGTSRITRIETGIGGTALIAGAVSEEHPE